jgi:hypothetical protein
MGGFFMRNIAWFVVGWLFAYQVCKLFPSNDGVSSIFLNFIMQPLNFLEGAIFIFASFLIFSYSIRYTIFSLVNLAREKKRLAVVYGIIGTITVILAWLVLLFESVYISMVIIFLSIIHLGLSMESLKKVTYKQR